MSIESALGKAAHDIVIAAEKVKAALVDAGKDLGKAAPDIQEAGTLLTGVATAISPADGAKVAAAVEAIIGKVLSVVDAASAAASANGLSVSLDAATVASVKAILPTVKAEATAAS